MCLAFILLVIISAANARRGGPDEFGYQFVDSDERDGPYYSWIEINRIGTPLGMRGLDDDAVRTISLPQPFTFYGIDYNLINICSNGWINFGSSYGWARYNFSPLPEPEEPNALLAVFATDLLPRTSPGDVYYYYDSGTRQFIVEYDGIIEYSSGTIPFKFEVILDFIRSNILFQYATTGMLTSHTATIGIENETGTIGLYYGTQNDLHNNLAILFYSRATANYPYFTSFETDDERTGFTTTDSTLWQWGNPTTGPANAHTGRICWATNIGGNYPPNANAKLITIALNARGLRHPIVDFWHWYSTEANIDGGNVKISTDECVSWSIVRPIGGYPVAELNGINALFGQPSYSGSSGGWQKVFFDLTEYAGQVFWLGFHFASDAGGESYPGWYIDDLGFYEAFGVLQGHIELAYGANDSGAIVRIAELGIADTTDSTGYFRFDSLWIGTYTVEITRTRYVSQRVESLSITFLDTINLNITLYPELYSSNFELDCGDLIPIPPDSGWQWGVVPDTIPPFGAFSGSRVWGTILNGRYANNANWKLDLRTALYTVMHPALVVWMWYSFSGEYGGLLYDGGNVKISVDDGATFEVVEPIDGYDGVVAPHNVFLRNQPAFGGLYNGNFWHQRIFDLTRYAGRPVIIRFEIGTDNVGTSWGWYLDDLIITEYTSIEKESRTPNKFEFSAFPNPFNESVVFNILTPYNTDGKLEIFNSLGELVFSIDGLKLYCGINKISWNTKNNHKNLPSGVYFARLVTKEKNLNLRVILLK